MQDPSTIPLAYAAPQLRGAGASAWHAFVLMFGGLGLVLLGGCFTIGILIMQTGPGFNTPSSPVAWTPGMYIFCGILYLLAFACFGGGATLIVLAARAALRHLRG